MTDISILNSFLSALLTLMTGFGLATILTPVFLIFYDVKIAILIVAVVHLSNNLLKVFLFSRHISIDILKRFGALTLIGAFIGAFLQGRMDSSVVKILLGIALIFPAPGFFNTLNKRVYNISDFAHRKRAIP